MTSLPFAYPVRHVLSGGAAQSAAYPQDLRSILNLEAGRAARAEISTWPGYSPTPLLALQGLAQAAGLEALWYKDEGGRFGLGSFKALGGAYAVLRLVQREVARGEGREPSSRELMDGAFNHVARELTVTSATDGNHGRSVAWGARLFGCPCVIYIHETVSEGREEAIAAYGARVERIPGTYDDAVRAAARDAETHGRHVVSDTAWEGYTDIPREVMQGYSVMMGEALEQLPPGGPPTHVFVQGGVGGLAAAVCAHLWETLGAERPAFVVVEPERADCLFLSAQAGRPTVVEGDLDTVMAGLAAGEVSLVAWEVLRQGVEAFLAIPDEAALETMRLLADPQAGDPPVVGGESGVAGLAGLLCALSDPGLKEALHLGPESRVLTLGSEGATDPALYEEIVGRAPDAVRDGSKK